MADAFFYARKYPGYFCIHFQELISHGKPDQGYYGYDWRRYQLSACFPYPALFAGKGLIEGFASIDESALTGERIFVEKHIGDKIAFLLISRLVFTWF